MRITDTTLRWVALLETVSFIGLLGAMLAGSEAGVSALGAVHGALFLTYMGALYVTREQLAWSMGYVALAILTGPVGAILVLERLRRERVQDEDEGPAALEGRSSALRSRT
ncbi:MAG: DUF3817 domain-containing protein [Actinomycetota bacterium]|nr:DUF3817 domain-containing protein [Actinomycetota bacterium]